MMQRYSILIVALCAVTGSALGQVRTDELIFGNGTRNTSITLKKATNEILFQDEVANGGDWVTLSELYESASAGNVSAPSALTDNAIVRGEGTTSRSVQTSGVLIDDQDRMSGLDRVTADDIITTAVQVLTTLVGNYNGDNNHFTWLDDNGDVLVRIDAQAGRLTLDGDGSFKLVTGEEEDGRFLRSNAYGLGEWSDLPVSTVTAPFTATAGAIGFDGTGASTGDVMQYNSVSGLGEWGEHTLLEAIADGNNDLTHPVNYATTATVALSLNTDSLAELTIDGLVSAGAVDATSVSATYIYAGGTTLTATSPGGSTGQLQYNDGGSFSGVSSVVVSGDRITSLTSDGNLLAAGNVMATSASLGLIEADDAKLSSATIAGPFLVEDDAQVLGDVTAENIYLTTHVNSKWEGALLQSQYVKGVSIVYGGTFKNAASGATPFTFQLYNNSNTGWFFQNATPTVLAHIDNEGGVYATSLTLTTAMAFSGGAYCDGSDWLTGSRRDTKTGIEPFTPVEAWSNLDAIQPACYHYKQRNPNWRKWIDPNGSVVTSTETLAILQVDEADDNDTSKERLAKVAAKQRALGDGYWLDTRLRLEEPEAQPRLGFIAEDLQAVDERLAPGGRGVSASAIAAHNTAALKAAKAEIAELRAMVVALTKRVEALESNQTGKTR